MPSTAELNARPELVFGPNPFIEAAEPFIPFDKLPSRLEHRPLRDRPWRQVQPASREALLAYSSLHFVATSLVLEPAAGIQLLLRRGLALRNPLDPQEQIRVNRVGTATSRRQLAGMTQLDGAGSLWAGMTGMGKTAIAKRTLEVICPDRVVIHEANQHAGWLRCVQCFYLYVDQSSNGSRGGLLHRILVALDEQLGTDYSHQHRYTRNLDVMLVVVTKLLAVHRVVLLVIDEKQARNFSESPWQIEFILFYLSLMNLGISVLLLGNPLAFEHLKIFSQVTRRFSIGGIFDLEPGLATDTWWRDDYVPGKQQFCLVDGCSVSAQRRHQLAHDASGGVPGLFEAFDVEAQRCALRRSSTKVVLEERDFAEARESPRYKKALEVAVSVQATDQAFSDVPAVFKRKSGASFSQSKQGAAAANVVASLLSRYKSEQTRLANNMQHRLRSLQDLSDDDLRMLGTTQEMLAALVGDSVHAQSVEKRKSKSDATRPKTR